MENYLMLIWKEIATSRAFVVKRNSFENKINFYEKLHIHITLEQQML